jgi:DMSO/TMAO reductase YedYZ molybdopterin-dependent catalytic subunit
VDPAANANADASGPDASGPEATARIARLLTRADEVRKAAPIRADAEVVRDQLADLLAEARSLLEDVTDEHLRLELAGGIARRVADLDQEEIAAMLVGSPEVSRAPTTVDDPSRVPAGQHLTPGWPVLHVGRAPSWTRDDVRLVVTGMVERRAVLSFDDLQALEVVEVVRDFHCVTTWSRLDNRWTGVRVRDVLALAGVRAGATHAVVSGAPAYSTNLHLDDLEGDDVLLAWAHDGGPLDREHGGPLRLVVPHLYGWKSVKWVTEVRLIDRDVRGYWEERGYHDRGDPWREERFRGD